MMRDALECPACRGRQIWQVERVLERDLGLTPMAVWIGGGERPHGSFELFVCAQCGLAEWWAHEIERLSQADPQRARPAANASACPHCRRQEIWSVPMRDQITGLGSMPFAADGPYARWGGERAAALLETWVCMPCGATRWRIAGDEEFVADAPLVRCRLCPSRRASVMLALDGTTEDLGTSALQRPTGAAYYVPRFVAAGQGLFSMCWWGRFHLRVCRDCRHVDWLGTKLEELRESSRFGIRKLDGTNRPQRGPYR